MSIPSSPQTLLRRALPLLGAVWLLAGCATSGGGATAPEASVGGSATYRERIALPPGAVFEAKLLDVSLADAPSVTLGNMRVTDPRVPLNFTIAYDPARIEKRHRYIVSATIRHGEQLLFITDTAHPVLGDTGLRQVDLLLKRVEPAPQAAPASR